ncbi:hypothetical protein [Corallococcus sp. RDP092CA]|uniref:hypothetical protein n=1 Tax=Corallococcus sp. RDP092CA TaxID=3109369 RepID=UPI0035AE9C73
MEEDAPPGEDISFPTPEEVSRTSSQERPWNYLTRVEAGPWALWPQRGGEAEGFMQVEPMLVLDGGEKFGANLGAPVRLRLWGGEAGAGRVRKEDWDSLSDFGQLVRALKLGADHLDDLSPKIWFEKSGAKALVDQAQRQVAKGPAGIPIRWHIAEQKTAAAIKELLEGKGITEIEIVFTPPLP